MFFISFMKYSSVVVTELSSVNPHINSHLGLPSNALTFTFSSIVLLPID